MPPKANKIATAIKNANSAVVKNYNAANRAINRAPAWVKWTIAAIAVVIIVYAIWKVFFAPKRREMFESGGVTYEEKSDTMVKFDYPGFNVFKEYNINNKENGMTGTIAQDVDGMPQFYNFSKDGDRTLSLEERQDRAAHFCNKTAACSGFQLGPDGGVFYLGPKILSPTASDLVTGSTGYKIFTKKAAGGTTVTGGTTVAGGTVAAATTGTSLFDVNAANTKVSETMGYEDFTGTGFDGIDFSGAATDHGQMSVEACVDKVRSGAISDMVYDKVNGKCYGKPINYDDVKEGKQTIFYNPSMYSASWHPSLKNMKVSQDKFFLVNKSDPTKYWMDQGWEFKAVEGKKYKDVTAWMVEDTGTGRQRIINSNGSARLAVDSGKSYLKMVHAGDNENYTHFTMEKIQGTVEEYYLRTFSGAYITTWKKENDNTTLYASLASIPVDLNNPSIRWIKIPYLTT